MRPPAAQDAPSTEPSSKAVLESRSSGPKDVVDQGAVWEQVTESEDALEVSEEEIPAQELADQIAVHRQIPITDPDSMLVNTSSEPILVSAQQLQWEAEDSGSEAGDIIRDAQFFQDAATEYQLTYQSLDEKYTHQAVLVKEASEALKASESCVSVLQEELMAPKCSHKADIHKAVGQALWNINLPQCNPTLANTSRRLHSCRDRYKHSKYRWRIYLQWVHPKRR